MKMYDMGTKIEKEQSKETKNVIDYPNLHLSDKIPDELFNKEIGSTCKIMAIAKIANKGIDENPEKKRRSLTFEIHQMGYSDDEKEVEEEVKRQLKND